MSQHEESLAAQPRRPRDTGVGEGFSARPCLDGIRALTMCDGVEML